MSYFTVKVINEVPANTSVARDLPLHIIGHHIMAKRARPSDAEEPLDWSKTDMIYNSLGRSGLKVSALSLGAWVTYGGTHDDEVSYQCMTAALRGGVNFFDNAEGYAEGNAETSKD